MTIHGKTHFLIFNSIQRAPLKRYINFIRQFHNIKCEKHQLLVIFTMTKCFGFFHKYKNFDNIAVSFKFFFRILFWLSFLCCPLEVLKLWKAHCSIRRCPGIRLFTFLVNSLKFLKYFPIKTTRAAVSWTFKCSQIPFKTKLLPNHHVSCFVLWLSVRLEFSSKPIYL